ncbi:MAG: hypothetical protein EHM33_00340 [Chloroflexi bacterium]|nr:MAG: hypothetical protein EHM33_00340 [Chloroflexota bacterium]
MALLDFLRGQQPEEDADPYAESPNSGLFGLFSPDQSSSLQEIGGILSGLAYGKPVDMGTLSYNRMLRDQRAKQDKKMRMARSYADKIRGSNPELADMIDANPDYIDKIMGKQIDDMMDPEAQFARAMLGGGDASPDNQAFMSNIAKRSGLLDPTETELTQLASAALAGGNAFSSALNAIIDNRRQQSSLDQAEAEKQAKLDSVEPFIQSIEEKDPALAAALRRQPDKAVELMEKEYSKGQLPEVQTYRDIFGTREPGDEREFSDVELATIKTRTGLPVVDQDIANRLYANGEEKLGETINQIRDEITAKDTNEAKKLETQAVQDRIKSEFEIKTAGQFRDDYDRRTKGYNKALDAGRQAMELVKQENLSAAQQMQVLYNYVKVLDSDSAVREGEVALGGKTASYVAQFEMYLNRVKNGEILPEQAVQEMLKATTDLGRFAEKRAFQIRKEYSIRAKENGIRESLIFGPLESEIDTSDLKSEFPEPKTPEIVDGLEVEEQ